MKSIRQRLLLWQIGALIVTAVLVSVLTYTLAWNGFNRVRDYGLQQIAYSVLRHGVRPTTPPRAAPPPAAANDSSETVADGEGREENPPDEEPYEDLGQFVSQIWTPGGNLVYSSLDSIGPPLQTPGLHIVEWDGELWRVYALAERGQVVQVAVTSSDRAASFAELAPWLLAPLGLLVLLLGLIIHTAVGSALAPLNAMGREIRRRDTRDLRAMPRDDLPEELEPLAEALNELLARVDGLLTTQRQLLADAAHELNTPLAAVKLQAQLARRASDAQRSAALDELDQGIERATHLVAQLLQMARLEPDVRERQPRAVRLDTLAARVVGAFSAQAEARDIDLGLDSSEAALVWADPAELRVLLDNLVDNATRYCPRGSRVDVRVERDASHARLWVCDNGRGIPAEDRERVLQRFVRLNPDDSTGSGLGLAIVASIVTQSLGQLRLQDTPGGGLSVVVEWPLAPAEAEAAPAATPSPVREVAPADPAAAVTASGSP